MRRRDLLVGLLSALAIHVGAGLCMGRLWSWTTEIRPEFQAGLSSVELTFVAPPPPAAPAVTPPAPIPEPSIPEILPTPEAEPLPPDPVAVPQIQEAVDSVISAPPIPVAPPVPAIAESPVDADGLEKGVEGTVVALGQIRPRYPLGSRLRGEEGLVRVQVQVSAEGKALGSSIVETSGFPALDRAAEEAVRRARFVTSGRASREGGELALTFRFKLIE